MPAVQHQLAFARPLQARVRSVRRPFRPSQGEGAYRLPRDIRERLVRELACFRNRDAALALAEFLGRFWSVPGRMAGSFPIDRRELADRPDLGLTEKRVRSAITTLEGIGYLERALTSSGSRYRATEDGLHRKPILFVFGPEFAPLFIAANKRARRAKGGAQHTRRPITPAPAPLSFVALSEVQNLKGPKSRERSETLVIMGPLRETSGLPAKPSAPNALELALQQLGEGVFGKPKRG